MPPTNQNVLMLQQAFADLKEAFGKLELRVENLEDRLEIKYDQLSDKLDNLFKWLIGVLITSILIPALLLLATYWINHPK